MSQQSQAVLWQAITNWQSDRDPAPLQAAAAGHLGASRPLAELLAEYAAAVEDQEQNAPDRAAAAQRIADELAPVRIAARIAAGGLPRTMDGGG